MINSENVGIFCSNPVDASNVDVTVSNLLREMGQPSYDAESGLKGIQTPQERVEIILSVMNELLDEDRDAASPSPSGRGEASLVDMVIFW